MAFAKRQLEPGVEQCKRCGCLIRGQVISEDFGHRIITYAYDCICRLTWTTDVDSLTKQAIVAHTCVDVTSSGGPTMKDTRAIPKIVTCHKCDGPSVADIASLTLTTENGKRGPHYEYKCLACGEVDGWFVSNYGDTCMGRNYLTSKSVYAIVDDTPGEPLLIEDVGHAFGHKTVTNDAHRVVQRLWDMGSLSQHGDAPYVCIEDRRLFYIDSVGSTDEIRHKLAKFTGFNVYPYYAQEAGQCRHPIHQP